MRSNPNATIEAIVGQILKEAYRHEVAPYRVMDAVRASFDNKMDCVKNANPQNAAQVMNLIMQQVASIEPVNCRCYSEGVWGSQILPHKIVYSGNRTIVFWNDGTKTIVKCAAGEEFDEYLGFIAAYAKKMFNSTSRLKKFIKTISTHDKSAERYKAKQLKKAMKKAKVKADMTDDTEA